MMRCNTTTITRRMRNPIRRAVPLVTVIWTTVWILSFMKVVSAEELFVAEGVCTPGEIPTGGSWANPDLLHIPNYRKPDKRMKDTYLWCLEGVGWVIWCSRGPPRCCPRCRGWCCNDRCWWAPRWSLLSQDSCNALSSCRNQDGKFDVYSQGHRVVHSRRLWICHKLRNVSGRWIRRPEGYEPRNPILKYERFP